LNVAEIEIGILDRQCLDRRLPDRILLTQEVDAWQHRRDDERRCIHRTFSRQEADRKMAKYYVPLSSSQGPPFSEEDRGKHLYLTLCWQNESGQKGSTSEILSTVVP
jgi:hypothetical protein